MAYADDGSEYIQCYKYVNFFHKNRKFIGILLAPNPLLISFDSNFDGI